MKVPPVWQAAQFTLTCAPVSLKAALLWLKVEGFQAVVLWHWAQFVPRLPPCASFLAWQLAQFVGVPLKAPLAWQAVQAALACAPLSWKAALLWLKVEGFQALVPWHWAQLEPRLPW